MSEMIYNSEMWDGAFLAREYDTVRSEARGVLMQIANTFFGQDYIGDRCQVLWPLFGNTYGTEKIRQETFHPDNLITCKIVGVDLTSNWPNPTFKLKALQSVRSNNPSTVKDVATVVHWPDALPKPEVREWVSEGQERLTLMKHIVAIEHEDKGVDRIHAIRSMAAVPEFVQPMLDEAAQYDITSVEGLFALEGRQVEMSEGIGTVKQFTGFAAGPGSGIRYDEYDLECGTVREFDPYFLVSDGRSGGYYALRDLKLVPQSEPVAV